MSIAEQRKRDKGTTLEKILFQEFSNDLTHNSNLRDDLETLNDLRLALKSGTGPYPNAPNYVDPIIDDNINSIKAQLMDVLFRPQYLAKFIHVTREGRALAPFIELAFHNYLHFIIQIESCIEVILDQYLANGFSFSKIVDDHNAWPRVFHGQEIPVPTIIPRHPHNLIFPASTKDSIRNAERICDIYRYSPDDFLRMADGQGWDKGNANKIFEKMRATDSSDDGSDGYEPKIFGVNRSVKDEFILVWETYSMDEKGERELSVFSPGFEEMPLKKTKWMWRDGTKREFPFHSYSNEKRQSEVYDSRGIPLMLKDNQLAATQFKRFMGLHYDYKGVPQFKTAPGTRQNIKSYHPAPGKVAPEGLEPMDFGVPSQQLRFDSSVERQLAALRAGSTQSAFSSEVGRTEKTATEATIQNLSSQTMNSSKIVNFARNVSVAYSDIWKVMRDRQIELPLFFDNEQQEAQFAAVQGGLQQTLYDIPFIVVSSITARNFDPVLKQQQLTTLQPYLIGNPFVRLDVLARYGLDFVDPFLAQDAVVQAGAGSPIEQTIQKMGEAIEKLAQMVQAHNNYITADAQQQDFLDEEFDAVKKTVLEHDETIQKTQAAAGAGS